MDTLIFIGIIVMNKFINMYKALTVSPLIHHTTMWFLLAMAGVTLLEAFVISTKGIHLTLPIIAAFSFASQVGKVLSVFLDDTELKTMGKVMLVVSIMSTVSIFTAFIDEELFVYAISITGVVSMSVGGVFGMKYDKVVRMQADVDFEEVQKLEKFTFAVSGLILGLIAMVLYRYDTSFILTLGIGLGFANTIYCVYVYVKFWSKYDTETTNELVKDHKIALQIAKDLAKEAKENSK